MSTFPFRKAAISAAFLNLAGCLALPVAAQTFSPYADFEAMTLVELSTLQMKLTYVGPQNFPIGSLVLFGPEVSPDQSLFDPYRRTQFSYTSDYWGEYLRFEATALELQSSILSIGTLPDVTPGDVAGSAHLSFALQNSLPTDKGFEAVLDLTQAAAVFEKLRLSFAANDEVQHGLNGLACHLGLLPPERPSDVSAEISVELTGFRLDKKLNLYATRMTATNTSVSAIAGPISVVFRLPGGVHFENATGKTCGTSPRGLEFVDLPGDLGVGEQAEVILKFTDTGQKKIDPTLIMVLAGEGAR